MNNNFNLSLYALKQLKENSTWYFFLGLGLVIFGTLAIIYALASTIFSVIYLGIFLIILGFFESAQAFKTSKWSNFFLHLFLCVLYITAGVFIAFNPAVNALSLTLLLAIAFIISGILRTIFAINRINNPHAGWLLLNGILTFILGILIWHQWPSSGLWVIGTFVGIDAIVTGWTWVMLSQAVKNFNLESYRENLPESRKI